MPLKAVNICIIGYYTGGEGYFTHNRTFLTMNGFDFHRDIAGNLTPAWEYSGKYSTFVFTQEAQKILRQYKTGNKVTVLSLKAFQVPYDIKNIKL